MAEVIGIASGIAGLMSLTIEVCKITHSYVTGVSGASSTVQRFLGELEDLRMLFAKIDSMIKATDGIHDLEGHNLTSLLSADESAHYVELLHMVRQKLLKRETDGSFRRKIKALTWPFSEQDTLQLIESFHRHLSRYSTALSAENL